MITLNFKNEHIYFAVEGIFETLEFSSKLKVQLNALWVANPDDNFVQSVNLTADDLAMIYRNVSSKPEGIAKIINAEMLTALQPQLMAASNMSAFMTYQGQLQAYQAYLVAQAAYDKYVSDKAAYDSNPVGNPPAVVTQPTVVAQPTVVIPNEATNALIALQAIDNENISYKAAKIASGKASISNLK